MCFIYPQVYNDGCEVRPGFINCVSCPQHVFKYRRTKEPCNRGKVIVMLCGPCPCHPADEKLELQLSTFVARGAMPASSEAQRSCVGLRIQQRMMSSHLRRRARAIEFPTRIVW